MRVKTIHASLLFLVATASGVVLSWILGSKSGFYGYFIGTALGICGVLTIHSAILKFCKKESHDK